MYKKIYLILFFNFHFCLTVNDTDNNSDAVQFLNNLNQKNFNSLDRFLGNISGNEKNFIKNIFICEIKKLRKMFQIYIAERLHGAALYNVNDYETVIKLYGKEALEYKDKEKLTPLIYAINFNKINAVKKLLSLGVNPNNCGPYKTTPLMYATKQNNVEIINLLLNFKADPNLKDNFGRTALDMAKDFKFENIVKFLIQYTNLYRSIQNNIKKLPPLITYIDKNDFNAVKILIENGLNINLTDIDGNSAVMHACLVKNEKILKLLLTKLPNLNLKNKQNKTALEIAKENNLPKIVKILEEHIDQSKIYENIESFPEKEIIVIIPSYNNEQWCIRCLKSVVSQRYKNFRIVYRDDCSSDKTYNLIQKYIQANKLEDKITLKRNDIRRFKAANLYLTIHSLDIDFKINDDAIIVIMDGDDHFPNEYALKVINKIYTKSDTWMTYGGYVEYPSMERGFDKPTKSHYFFNNQIRKSSCNSSQLRTFYAWLFKEIKLEDFFYEGKFLITTSDVAKVFPMLEMSGFRYYHFDFPIYMYNRENAINDDKVRQKLQYDIDTYIRSKKSYNLLKEPIKFEDRLNKNNIAVFIFSTRDDKNLLSQFNNNIQGYDQLVIMNPKLMENFKKELMEKLNAINCTHLFLCKDNFNKSVNLKKIINFFERTSAFCAYTNLGKINSLIYEPITTDIWAFQYNSNKNINKYSFDGCLYKKDMLIRKITETTFNSFENLQTNINLNEKISDEEIGLLFN